MRTTIPDESFGEPFLFFLFQPFDIATAAEDLRISRLAGDSYDPDSQVSLEMSGKGTSRTFSSTGTGTVFNHDHDDRPSDT